MKEVKIQSKLLREKKSIATAAGQTLSFIEPNLFVITESLKNRLILAFQSRSLADLISRSPGLKIIHLEFARRYPVRSMPCTEIELRLILDTAEMMLLSGTDQILICRMLNASMLPDNEFPACDYYDLPEKAPFSRMLLKDRLICQLDEMAEVGQHLHLLHILWRDFEQELQRRKGSFSYGDIILVNGEFIQFTARKLYYQDQVAFDIQ